MSLPPPTASEREEVALAETFDPTWYLQAYPDVQQAGLDPWDHFSRIGRFEGRQGRASTALRLDHLLWRGRAAEALPGLVALLRGADRREQALAGWVMARWSRDQGDAPAALAAIEIFHSHAVLGLPALDHPGPWLLAVELCLGAGDVARARAHLTAAQRRFGARPDFLLAEFACLKALGAEAGRLGDMLAGIWQPEGLVPVEILDLPGPRFDRLGSDYPPRAAWNPAWAATGTPPGAGPSPSAGQSIGQGAGQGAGQDLPLVTVIVPVRDGASVIGTALRGLLAQSWPALEILVIDDGSQDGTAELVTRLAKRDPRLRLLRQPRPEGAYPARNRGLAEARGDFITLHDADDWSHPQKIERQVLPLLERPELMATVSHWLRVDEDLTPLRWRMEDGWTHRNVSSLMIRAALRDALGFWDRVQVNADTEYYYRLIAAYGAAAIHEVLPGVPMAFGRSWPGSLTACAPTHLRTQFAGLRRDYMDAAQDWHGRADRLYLPQFPLQRPFRVPAGIALGDPEPDPVAFDILSQSPLFDPVWYGRSHPDVMNADLNAVAHYLRSGAAENRDPGPGFSSGGYRLVAGLGAAENPLLHYEQEGRDAGLDPLPSLPGALADAPADAPRWLVFAHSMGKALFGAERSFLDMLTRMRAAGGVPVVVVPELHNRAYLDQLLQLSAAVECLPQLWWRLGRAPHPQTLARVEALIARHAAAEVHVNTMVLDAPRLAARAAGVPVVVHVRELPPEDPRLCEALGADAARLREALLQEADRFIVASQRVADWLDCPERCRIRPNAVAPELFELPFAPAAGLRVAIVSSNIAKKGLRDFLEIARRCAVERPQIRFLIFGPATRDLHLLQPFPANVEFRGYVATPDRAMVEADLVVSLSKFAESFGRTVMEAMAAGRPVICYARGVPPDLVAGGAAAPGGLVVPADDIETAALAVLALDAARGALLGFSQAARARAAALQRAAQEL